MKELWPHLVKMALSVGTIALGTYLGFVLYDEFGSKLEDQLDTLAGSAALPALPSDTSYSDFVTQ